jgi:hypothetical protein
MKRLRVAGWSAFAALLLVGWLFMLGFIGYCSGGEAADGGDPNGRPVPALWDVDQRE